MCKRGGAAFRCATHRAEIMQKALEELAAATYIASPEVPRLSVAARQATVSYAATPSGFEEITARYRESTGERKRYLGKLLESAKDLAVEERLERRRAALADSPEGSPLPTLGVKEAQRWARVSEDFKDSPELVEQWRRTGFDPDTAASWHTYDIAPAEAVKWHAKKYTPGVAADWRENGFSFDEGFDWAKRDFRPMDAKQWQDERFTAAEAEYWRDSGVEDPSDASEGRRQNVDPEDWAEAGSQFGATAAAYYSRQYGVRGHSR